MALLTSSGLVHLHSLPRDDSLVNEDVDETLKWLHIFLGQQIVIHGHSHEVNEAAVELKVPIDMPEWVVPVAVVEMSIASEHLLDDALDILMEIGRKARRFADPFLVGSSKC